MAGITEKYFGNNKEKAFHGGYCGTDLQSCLMAGDSEYREFHRLLEGYTVLAVTIIYTVVTFMLLIALGIARKKRKALNTDKTNVVFMIILGICVSDILVSVAGITEKYFGNSEEKSVYGGFCGTDWQYMMVVFDEFSQRIQKFGRLASTLLALSTAVIRALTVLFPMSSMIDKLLKKRSAYIIVLVIWMLCGIRIIIDHLKYGIIVPGTNPRSCYISAERVFQEENRLLEGYTVLAVTFIYTIVTFILLVALGIARKKRKALNTDKLRSIYEDYDTRPSTKSTKLLNCARQDSSKMY
ncbi:unnamed protein product [Caenorhabditis nigoni]